MTSQKPISWGSRVKVSQHFMQDLPKLGPGLNHDTKHHQYTYMWTRMPKAIWGPQWGLQISLNPKRSIL